MGKIKVLQRAQLFGAVLAHPSSPEVLPTMAGTRIAAIILIVIGITALAWGGISWTREKTVIDLGPIQAKTETRETLPIPPIVGGIALVAGIVLLVLPAGRRITG
jgi:uncharacterized membrane protein YidH (DUF202 family)